MKLIMLLVALLLLMAAGTLAQPISPVPSLMNFQGRLLQPNGTPFADGDYSIRFSFWSAASGGIERWNQTIDPVMVRKGTFSVLLSSFPAGTFNGDLWLEIQVETDPPLTPREQLVSVAYAMKANSVADGMITSASIANGTITGADIANGTITTNKLATNALNSLAWLLSGNSGTINAFLGTTDLLPLHIRVNNRRAMHYRYAENTAHLDSGFHYRSINILGGADINEIGAGIAGATIAGGGRDNFMATDEPNRALDNFSTVGGGSGNTADGQHATIGGGRNNTAIHEYNTIGGGFGNITRGYYSTVAGGAENTTDGEWATVPGGRLNSAAGDCSFAAGLQAKANNNGTFVWADSSSFDEFASTSENQFLIRATRGVGIGTTRPWPTLHLMGTSGPPTGLSADNNGLLLGSNGTASYKWIHSYGGPLVLNNHGNNVGIGITNPAYKLHVNGTFGVSSLPFGDRRNVQWDDTTGQFFYDNSTRRHKENITPLHTDFEKLLLAEPVTYTRPGSPDRWEIGFIAEDFDALGLKKLVDYDKEGKPDGINYEKICVYLTAIARKQAEAITAQQKKMDAQQKLIEGLRQQLKQHEQQQTQIEELKRRLDAMQTHR
jgi:hypothetical protein